MSGEQSVRSDEASNFRKILERTSPDSSSFRSDLTSDRDSRKAHKAKTHRSSSHRHHQSHRHRDRDRAIDSGLLETRHISRLLAQDEIEAAGMRKVLLKTSERLEQETRRANDAENRAQQAEARALAMQLANQNVQAELIREREAIKAYQAQLDRARNEILHAQQELDSMADDKYKAEEEAAKDRSKARAIAKDIEIRQALEQGRREGKIQGFQDGRKEGWYIGTRDGRREALRDLSLYDDADSVSSGSSVTPPPTSGHHAALGSVASTAARAAGPPPSSIDPSAPANHSQTNPRATSTRTATNHKRSGSLTQAIKSRLGRGSGSQPLSVPNARASEAGSMSARKPSSERLADHERSAQNVSSASRDNGRSSPLLFNAPSSPGLPPPRPPPSPRLSQSPRPSQSPRLSQSPRPTQTSPLGLIPLQENGRVNLPAPHGIDPPPSPHSPSIPLPPDITHDGLLGSNLQTQDLTANTAPTITVQEPTPPEPAVTMPEPHPAPFSGSAVDNAAGSSRSDFVIRSRPESPPLPPLPTERGGKGKQRQRVRPRGGLHAPGRSSPSDTSTEISQFDIVTANGAMDLPERTRLALARGNGSKLSVIMEGGSTAAESPEPAPGVGGKPQGMPRVGGTLPFNHSSAEEIPRPPSTQGILHDPREYGDLPEAQLSPSQIAQRQAIAEQLRFAPSDGDLGSTSRMRNMRDDVSIKSTTTHASAPRRRPNVRMPERLGPSRAVEALEKQAEMYDAFGTGRFPSFEPLSSPDDAVSTRTPPDFRKGHRKAMSSATSVPDITIQPPSRSSSHASRVSTVTRLSPLPASVPGPVPSTPSRRHSVQGPPTTPSMVPLPHSTVQVPMTLDTPYHGEFTLPLGFVPTQGPPEAREEISSGFPSQANTANMSAKTPRMVGGPPNLSGITPAGIPLPLSSATTHRGLPDTLSSAPRGTGRSSNFDLPNVTATYETVPLSPGIHFPPGFVPAGGPLPDSMVGNSPRTPAIGQTPWAGSSGTGVAPTPVLDRPMAMYAGDGGAKQKVSPASLSSLHGKFDSDAYLNSAVLASIESVPKDGSAKQPDIAGSSPSRSIETEHKSPYATSIETVTDEDDPPRL